MYVWQEVPSRLLTLFRMGLFVAAHGRGSQKGKICDIYPTLTGLCTLSPYLKTIKKHINHVTQPLSFATLSIFSPETNNFCYIRK